MKVTLKHSMVFVTAIVAAQLLHAYQRTSVKYGQEKPAGTTYMVKHDVWHKGPTAVQLTSQELRSIERLLRQHVNSTRDFSTPVTESFINTVKSGCNNEHICDILEAVLKDFKGKTVRELFTTLGLQFPI